MKNVFKSYLQVTGFLAVGTVGIQYLRHRGENRTILKEEVYACLAVSVFWPITTPLGIGTIIYQTVYDEKLTYNLKITSTKIVKD